MIRIITVVLISLNVQYCGTAKRESFPRTHISIEGEKFFINGRPTFEGRQWQGYEVEGLLPNARLVQGIFDDFNEETSDQWTYPDTEVWDADRNTAEFLSAMPDWRAHGMLCFTINMQAAWNVSSNATMCTWKPIEKICFRKA